MQEHDKKLLIHYKDQKATNFGQIDLGKSDIDGNPEYIFGIENLTKYHVNHLRLVTNLPDTVYSASYPTSIDPESKITMKVSINNKKLFAAAPKMIKDGKHKLELGLKWSYELRFEE